MENITQKDIEKYLKGKKVTPKIIPPKKITPRKTEPKKNTTPKRKIDHSSDYSRARMDMRAMGKTDGMATAKRPSYFQDIDAKSKKKEKNNIVKTRSGGKVRTRSGFVKTGR
jgi:hypothetical protein